jgi:hypothetical protein
MISPEEKARFLSTKTRAEFESVLKDIFGDKQASLADIGDEVWRHLKEIEKTSPRDPTKKRIY